MNPDEDQPDATCGCLDRLVKLLANQRRCRALLDVDNERTAQVDRWGDQRHDPFTWLSILTEEVGEAHKAALHDRFGGPAAGTFREELVQVAAVAVQIIEVMGAGELHAPPRGGVALEQVKSPAPGADQDEGWRIYAGDLVCVACHHRLHGDTCTGCPCPGPAVKGHATKAEGDYSWSCSCGEKFGKHAAVMAHLIDWGTGRVKP